ncbi:MAG: response regulator [Candidatus Nitrosopumilus sp. bin_7KS]
MVSCIVIDDDQDVLDVFCELLSIVGVDVMDKGTDGKEAERLYEKHRPDLIFVDLLMPEYDGFYAIERIRSINPNAKIVIVTGDLKAGESYLLDSYNVSAIIYKPFDIHMIKQVLVDIFLV